MMNLGYACINMSMGKKVTTNRAMVKRTFQTKGLDYVSELAFTEVPIIALIGPIGPMVPLVNHKGIFS